ncbi:HAMP domain-containing sensor histidine kinase [Actinomycetospora sp. TBRC 11914]|uniref:sensor histidine kinase n=1 Tax=Actinomycetospora sp. TBRC 11914 TaxID=2729387 RepID=UPI00145E364B|nr:HAMP domain-containing sensor histidine kinase [Actinomycetospora sp. TBRC 11914]NMO88529.1 HAMP domain-containing histidine kinase [Actinomycetospora sp. TBRC 11914]
MSLRARFALAFALVSAVVAGLVGVLSYHAVADRTTQANDTTLTAATTALAAGQTGVLGSATPPADDDGGGGPPRGDRSRGDTPGRFQMLIGRRIAADGTVTVLGGRPVVLPVTDAARGVVGAAAAGRTDTTELTVGRDDYRVLTTSLGGGTGALQVAMDVDLSNRLVQGMANEITVVSLVVLVVAAAVGWLLAGRITQRLVRLTGLAEQVSARGGVSGPDVEALGTPVEGHDEVGRLSASFRTMVERLASSREAQDRLVQDAAHELRTPLTSLRTNASVLRRFAELSPAARERLVTDVQGETRELSQLVDELVDLALSGHTEEPEEAVALAPLAERVADRVARRSGREIVVDADDSVVRGYRASLERGVGNLLENAAKFDGDSGEPVELRVRAGTTTVRDHGPGILPADADRVFDRFYRADAARGLPGSGLGLAIVRDVAERHGGAAFVTTPSGGGACVGFGVATDRLVADDAPDGVEAPPAPESSPDSRGAGPPRG